MPNQKSITNIDLVNRLLSRLLDVSKIIVPTRIIAGQFDFVVPEEQLQDQFDQLGASDKSIHILSKSSHSVIAHEVDKVLDIIFNFVQ